VNLSAINAVFGFVIIMVIAFLIFFRIRIGSTGSTEGPDRIKSAYRRNNLVIVFIIVFYISYWFVKFSRGDYAGQDLSLWKLVGLGAVLMLGFASVILIVYGSFKRKK